MPYIDRIIKDFIQPIDALLQRVLRVVIGNFLDVWLPLVEKLKRYKGKMSIGERRVLMSEVVEKRSRLSN